jgi:hypothetical protein
MIFGAEIAATAGKVTAKLPFAVKVKVLSAWRVTFWFAKVIVSLDWSARFTAPAPAPVATAKSVMPEPEFANRRGAPLAVPSAVMFPFRALSEIEAAARAVPPANSVLILEFEIRLNWNLALEIVLKFDSVTVSGMGSFK